MAQLTNQAQAIPSDLAEQRSGRSNLKFIVGGLLLIAVVIALIVQATMSTGAYYMTVNEVRSGAANLVGQRIRVNGAVVPGSENWNAQEITLRFAISDETSKQDCRSCSMARGLTTSSVQHLPLSRANCSRMEPLKPRHCC